MLLPTDSYLNSATPVLDKRRIGAFVYRESGDRLAIYSQSSEREYRLWAEFETLNAARCCLIAAKSERRLESAQVRVPRDLTQ